MMSSRYAVGQLNRNGADGSKLGSRLGKYSINEVVKRASMASKTVFSVGMVRIARGRPDGAGKERRRAWRPDVAGSSLVERHRALAVATLLIALFF